MIESALLRVLRQVLEFNSGREEAYALLKSFSNEELDTIDIGVEQLLLPIQDRIGRIPVSIFIKAQKEVESIEGISYTYKDHPEEFDLNRVMLDLAEYIVDPTRRTEL